MGFIRENKANAMAQWAQQAWDEGLTYFTPTLALPVNHVGAESPIPDWGQSLSAATAVGWRLESWSVSHDGKGRPHAFPVFIRP